MTRYLFAGQTTGRPREKWYVGDHARARIDAAMVRREAHARGVDLGALRGVEVTHGPADALVVASVAVVCVPCGLDLVRLWLICPGCGKRRGHLYPTKGRGVRCRVCLRDVLRYPDRRARFRGGIGR